MSTMERILRLMAEKKASDVYLSANAPALIKINGECVPINNQILPPDAPRNLLSEVVPPDRIEELEETGELNMGVPLGSLGRFRVSAFWQQDMPGMVLRRIETRIPTFDELVLPPILQEVAMAKRGLVLFVGATGAGKSTTQAAMIGFRNQHGDGHILTVEDPVEFVHQHDRCLVTQREVGIDTASFDVALKNSLRQAPDVILIGEIRSQETMEFAIQFAETGHLCLATLHANNANQALDRILHLVPQEKHRQFLFDLSFNLRAIVAQQLLPSAHGQRRVAAFEILLNTPLVTDIIRKGEMHRLKEVMTKSGELGMQTFDQALFTLFCAGQIGYSEALAHADSANDLRLLIKLSGREQLGAGTLDNVTLDE